jgi:fatty-acyl-CoA synthase
VIGLMQDRPLALPPLVDRAAEMLAHKSVVTATPTGEVRTTWGAVISRARRLAGVLDALAVPAGARIATFGWNSQRHLELYLAVPSSGRVLHTLNHRLFHEQLRFIIDHAADDVVFVDRSLVPAVWPVLEQSTGVRWIVLMDDGDRAELPADPRLRDYEDLLAGAVETDWADIVDEREAATLCYTSGTTGNPKGVLSSHRSVVLHALMLLGVDAFGLSERDVAMPIVPMFHVNAWGLPYAALLAGSDLVLPGPAMSPEALIDQLVRHRVTVTAGVPAIWRSLEPLLPGADLSALRMVVSGGSALPASLSRAWEDATGVPITSSWGMTEASPLVAFARLGTVHNDLAPDEQRAVLAVPGPTVPLAQVRIVDGEVQLAGPTIASGYYGAGPGGPSFTADGWLRTGDVGTLDELGYLRIVDRTKDLVKSGGEWISSVELENEIMAHPDVAEAAVVGVPDERWGERPVAFVIPTAGIELDAASLRDHLATRVASWWVPERFELVFEFPRTATGKVSKVALRDGLAGDGAT